MEDNKELTSSNEQNKDDVSKAPSRDERIAKITAETTEWLKSDPAIQAYFSNFSTSSIDTFIGRYAHIKSMYSEYGSLFQEMMDVRESAYLEQAEECLKEIQYKKLFDLYCQWNAEQIVLEGVTICWEFYAFADDILNCKILTPIQQDELDLYLAYMNSHHYEYNSYFSWMDVCDIRSDSEDVDQLPSWFLYHNQYTGAGSNLLLPKIREEKEDFYRELNSKEKSVEIEAKYASGELQRHVPDERPHLWGFDYNEVMNFMKRFETPDNIRLYDGYYYYGRAHNADVVDDDNDYINQQVQDILHAMDSLKGIVIPIEANADWRKGLITAWHKFEKEQTIACLPFAYDNYLFRLANKIQFPAGDRDMEGLVDNIKKQILRGRVLNGEPEDFNF
jgi:hypothetical protein